MSIESSVAAAWFEEAESLVTWFKNWAEATPREQGGCYETVSRDCDEQSSVGRWKAGLVDELPTISSRCHDLRNKSNALIEELSDCAASLGISLQPILDFLDALDRQFEKRPVFREAFPVHGTYSLQVRKYKAASVILALIAVRSQAIAAKDRSKDGLTVTEAADLYDLPRYAISRAANKGLIKSNGRQGRARRLDPESVQQWALDKRKAESQEGNSAEARAMRRRALGK
jgi:hypothetical protein